MIHVGESCYQLSSEGMNWFSAQEVGWHKWVTGTLSVALLQFCWERGGYLAELQSSEEESSLDPFIPNQVLWIGLTDAAKEGTLTS